MMGVPVAMPTIIATVIAGASVLASSFFALRKPEWLRRSSGRWASSLLFLSLLCLWTVYFWAEATVGTLADKLTYEPDSSLRSAGHTVIGWAVDARHTYYPPFLILLGAAAYVWGIRALRDLPSAPASQENDEPANAA